MQRYRRLGGYGCIVLLMVLATLGSPSLHALEVRVGSLEFSYTSPPDPLGLVSLNTVATGTPSISYQIPVVPGGHFFTPWGLVFDQGVLVEGTLMVLTNPDPDVTLAITIAVHDGNGAVGPGCTRTANLMPRQTRRLIVVDSFPTCAALTPGGGGAGGSGR